MSTQAFAWRHISLPCTSRSRPLAVRVKQRRGGPSGDSARLLLSLPYATVVIAGDAVASHEHLEQGRVLRGAADIEQARVSIMEVFEIADVIVPGHDNIVLNPARRRA